MALDHYISRVHLKQFRSRLPGGMICATRKCDLKEFNCHPENVCRIEQGNTNPFLSDERLLERLLKEVEPAYEPCLQSLRIGKLDDRVREVFGGFVAAVSICAPTFKRLSKPGTVRALRDLAEDIHKKDPFPPFPDNEDVRYSGRSLPDLLREGLVDFDVDLRMPQAVLATKLENLVRIYVNCHWDVVHISKGQSLLSSDYPIALLEGRGNGWVAKLVPLAPDIGIIFHTPTAVPFEGPCEISSFDVSSKSVVASFNRAIIQSSESVVFSNSRPAWLPRSIENNKDIRLDVDPATLRLKYSKMG